MKAFLALLILIGVLYASGNLVEQNRMLFKGKIFLISVLLVIFCHKLLFQTPDELPARDNYVPV